jgi:glycerophosphoryl diester phosphodiesterase
MRCGPCQAATCIAAATISVVALSSACSRPDIRGEAQKRSEPLLVIGHRGNPEDAPENTLASVNAALQLGVDLIEVDVRLTRDDVPVIFHDETVERTTNGRGAVANLTLRELKELDAGSWKDVRFAGERIPTLEETLRSVKGRGRLLLDVPVDHMGPRIRAALDLVGIPVREAVLGTWSPEQREEFRRHMPDATIFRSEDIPEPWEATFFTDHRSRGVAAFEIANWSPEFIRDAHAARFPVYVYTVNDEPTMRSLIVAGADGIETDVPGVALKMARQLGARP